MSLRDSASFTTIQTDGRLGVDLLLFRRIASGTTADVTTATTTIIICHGQMELHAASKGNHSSSRMLKFVRNVGCHAIIPNPRDVIVETTRRSGRNIERHVFADTPSRFSARCQHDRRRSLEPRSVGARTQFPSPAGRFERSWTKPFIEIDNREARVPTEEVAPWVSVHR